MIAEDGFIPDANRYHEPKNEGAAEANFRKQVRQL